MSRHWDTSKTVNSKWLQPITEGNTRGLRHIQVLVDRGRSPGWLLGIALISGGQSDLGERLPDQPLDCAPRLEYVSQIEQFLRQSGMVRDVWSVTLEYLPAVDSLCMWWKVLKAVERNTANPNSPVFAPEVISLLAYMAHVRKRAPTEPFPKLCAKVARSPCVPRPSHATRLRQRAQYSAFGEKPRLLRIGTTTEARTFLSNYRPGHASLPQC